MFNHEKDDRLGLEILLGHYYNPGQNSLELVSLITREAKIDYHEKELAPAASRDDA